MANKDRPVLSRGKLLEQLQSMLPDAVWILKQIESEQGWYRFPKVLVDAIDNLRLHSYPLLYTSEAAIGNMLYRAIFTTEERQQLEEAFEDATPEQLQEDISELIDALDQVFEGFEIPKTHEQQQEARRLFESMSPDEKKEAIRVGQGVWCTFLCIFHQNLSTMVHGETLTSLVAQAQAGNDDAFVKAVQIDRRILTTIPYFRARYERSQMEAHSEFSDKLSYRLGRAPYIGKIRHKTLWLTLSLLDQVGWLDAMPHGEILKICDEVGINSYENRIESEQALTKRIKQYREFQKRGLVTTP